MQTNRLLKLLLGLALGLAFSLGVDLRTSAHLPFRLENAYIIGQENFERWSQGFDENGYLKVLPHPDVKIPFKDPFQDWQADRSGNYVSSWGAPEELKITLKAEDLDQINIDGFGVLKSGDGKISWLDNQDNPYEFLNGFNGTIPGPMFITEPGDTLKIKLENHLDKLAEPINLHTHGLHVSPVGHGDNSLISIDSGEDREIRIQLPETEAIATNWYHPHLHGLSNQQISAGLAGSLWVAPPHHLPDPGRRNPKTEKIHFMALNTFGIQQINRSGKSGDPLNQDPSISIPAGTPLQVLGETKDGERIYELSDAFNYGHNSKPVNYNPQLPLGIPHETIPTFYGGGFTSAEPIENVIYTVNGQYNPTLELKTGEWNTFTLTNVTSDTFHVIQVVKQEENKLVPQRVGLIGMDTQSSALATNNAVGITELPLLNPASRVSIQKWFAEPGTYYLLSNGTEELLGDNTSPLIKGRKGFDFSFTIWGPQVLATLEVTGDVISSVTAPEPYAFQTQLAGSTGDRTASPENAPANREREFTWAGNFGAAVAAGNPVTLEGAWRINGDYFAPSLNRNMVPLTLPMLDTTELWTIRNTSGQDDTTLPVNSPFREWHPFHIHQNDFTVLNINGFSIKDLVNPSFHAAQRDTFPLAPTHSSGSPNPINPYGVTQSNGDISVAQLLMSFDDYPGTFMNHCHILDHQDAGMMLPVRVILNTRDTWLGLGTKEHSDGQVQLIRASNLHQRISLAPYGNEFKGAIDVAIADVNYKQNNETQNVTDNVTDVVVIQQSPDQDNKNFTVKVFDGRSLIHQQENGKTHLDGSNPDLLLAKFTPFAGVDLPPTATAAIASGDINGDGYADIAVGIGGNRKALVEIYSGQDFSLLTRIAPFHHEIDFNGAMNIAIGDINADNFDDIIVSQSKGGKGLVELYSGQLIDQQGSLDGEETSLKTALLSQLFQPYGDFHGEVKVTSGYVLQRPEVSNGEAVQTHHANITTLAVEDEPDKQKIKVFTYLLDEHQVASHESDSAHTTVGESIHQQSATHVASTDLFDLSELRLDATFTSDRQLDNLSGTFADIPGLHRGEPVLLTSGNSGTPELIHLEDKNSPRSIPISVFLN